MSAALPDPAKVLAAYLREAVAQTKLAYGYVPNSFTYSALQTCLAAEQALEAVGESLSGESDAVADLLEHESESRGEQL